MRRAERAAEAVALRGQGLTASEIAARMGISRSYAAELYGDPTGEKERARKDRYRLPCPQCGTLMSGSDGMNSRKTPRLCLRCERIRATNERKWTRESMIAAVHLWAEEHGQRPTAREWLRSKDPRFPPVSLVTMPGVSAFASWADLIEAAGYERPQVGVQLNRKGKGASLMPRTYVVLERNNRGTWREHRTEAYSPETAIEAVATHAGRYVVLLEQYFNEVDVEPVKKFAITRNGPESEEAAG